jgi:hypothetical protein
MEMHRGQAIRKLVIEAGIMPMRGPMPARATDGGACPRRRRPLLIAGAICPPPFRGKMAVRRLSRAPKIATR